ncbi:MAG: hypothetical protein KJ607_03470 [Bacteroidetes bacterium]|nr:hypothetical protein [Bacteroidota bacterium]
MKNLVIVMLIAGPFFAYAQYGLPESDEIVSASIYYEVGLLGYDWQNDFPVCPALTHTPVVPDERAHKKLIDAFLYKVRRNPESVNFIYGSSVAPGYGRNCSFKDLTDYFNSESGIYIDETGLIYNENLSNRSNSGQIGYNTEKGEYRPRPEFTVFYKMQEPFVRVETEGLSGTARNDEERLYDVVCSAGFFEKWSFDAKTATFRKEIKRIRLNSIFHDGERVLPIFDFAMAPYTLPVMPIKLKKGYIMTDVHLIADSVVYEITLSGRNEDGVYIVEDDFDSPENTSCYYHIPAGKRSSFIALIFKCLFENRLQAFSIGPDLKPYGNPLNKNEILDLMTDKDSTYIWDEYGAAEVRYTKEEVGFGEISGICFFERWYLDAQNFSLYKEVTGICPVRYKERVYDSEERTGEYRKYPLFYIPFEMK